MMDGEDGEPQETINQLGTDPNEGEECYMHSSLLEISVLHLVGISLSCILA